MELNFLNGRNSLFKNNSSTLIAKHKFEQPKKALDTQSSRALCLESIDVLSSKSLNKDKFTNFQSHSTKNECS